MLRTRVLAAALVFIWAAIPGHGQSGGDFLKGWNSCEEMKAQCAGTSAEYVDQIYNFALLGATYPYLGLGTCYVHDNKTPPGTTYQYACFNYVKLSYLSGSKGYDNGTGCVGTVSPSPAAEQASRHQAALILQELCSSGACCCPTVQTKPCGINIAPVRRRDPVSGSCCTFPNACSAPSDWQVPGSADCK
jgi:hypothetical protein